MDKQLFTLQDGFGAVGAIVTHTLVRIEDQCIELAKTAQEYADPNEKIDNPREESRFVILIYEIFSIFLLFSGIFMALKEKLLNKWAKDLSDLAKITGAQHNKLLMMRRALYLKRITKAKGAKTSVKRLSPNEHFLFGGQVGEVCKDLKASSELNPLSTSKNGGIGRKNTSPFFQKKGWKGGKGGLRDKSYAGSSGPGKGAGGGSRLARFKVKDG